MAEDNYISFGALTVVSPAMLCGEPKDQDRAMWYSRLRTACLADGVSSSPYAAQAASQGVRLGPLVSLRGASEGLRTISNVLLMRRMEAQSRGFKAPSGTSEALQPMLEEAVQARLADAYQTTIAVATLTSSDHEVLVNTVVCGDSAVIAFSNTGEVLDSSLDRQRECGHQEEQLENRISENCERSPSAGNSLLIKILGRLSDSARASEAPDILPNHRNNWFVCQILDEIPAAASKESSSLVPVNSRDELFLVPQFLLGTLQLPADQYRKLIYSRRIRRLGSNRNVQLRVKGSSVTAVLPDHVQSGHWAEYAQRYPLDVQLVLASDGFYGCFDTHEELWSWLSANATALRCETVRRPLLAELHSHLHRKQGDDDISFVWIQPFDGDGSAKE